MRGAFLFLISLLLSVPSLAGLDERIKVTIEEPVAGGVYSSISNLRGWAVSPAGMAPYLDVYIDDQFVFNMVVYGDRADVGNAFPDYPDSNTGGFSMAFNYKNLSPGEHKLRVRAFDNAGNYNDAVTTFSTVRFSSPFISDDVDVDLSTLTSIYSLNNQSLFFEGATIEGRSWDFRVSWDKASQGLVISDIEDKGKVVGGVDSGDTGTGTPPSTATRISATCNTYVTSVSSSSVEFENGAILRNIQPDLVWSEEDPAFFVEFADRVIFVVQYDPALLTKVDRNSRWSAFVQGFEGTPPETCTFRSRKAARPLIPDYSVGNIYDYKPYEFVRVLPCTEFDPRPASCHKAGIPRYNLKSDKACPTWDLEDQVLVPETYEYMDSFPVDPVINLTRLRYPDGRPWCDE